MRYEKGFLITSNKDDIWCWNFYEFPEWVPDYGGYLIFGAQFTHSFKANGIRIKSRDGLEVTFIYQPRYTHPLEYTLIFANEEDLRIFTNEEDAKISTNKEDAKILAKEAGGQ